MNLLYLLIILLIIFIVIYYLITIRDTFDSTVKYPDVDEKIKKWFESIFINTTEGLITTRKKKVVLTKYKITIYVPDNITINITDHEGNNIKRTNNYYTFVTDNILQSDINKIKTLLIASKNTTVDNSLIDTYKKIIGKFEIDSAKTFDIYDASDNDNFNTPEGYTISKLLFEKIFLKKPPEIMAEIKEIFNKINFLVTYQEEPDDKTFNIKITVPKEYNISILNYKDENVNIDTTNSNYNIFKFKTDEFTLTYLNGIKKIIKDLDISSVYLGYYRKFIKKFEITYYKKTYNFDISQNTENSSLLDGKEFLRSDGYTISKLIYEQLFLKIPIKIPNKVLKDIFDRITIYKIKIKDNTYTIQIKVPREYNISILNYKDENVNIHTTNSNYNIFKLTTTEELTDDNLNDIKNNLIDKLDISDDNLNHFKKIIKKFEITYNSETYTFDISSSSEGFFENEEYNIAKLLFEKIFLKKPPEIMAEIKNIFDKITLSIIETDDKNIYTIQIKVPKQIEGNDLTILIDSNKGTSTADGSFNIFKLTTGELTDDNLNDIKNNLIDKLDISVDNFNNFLKIIKTFEITYNETIYTFDISSGSDDSFYKFYEIIGYTIAKLLFNKFYEMFTIIKDQKDYTINFFEKINLNIKSQKDCPIMKSIFELEEEKGININGQFYNSAKLNLFNKLNSLFYNLDSIALLYDIDKIFDINIEESESESGEIIYPEIVLTLGSTPGYNYKNFINYNNIKGSYEIHDILKFIEICINLNTKIYLEYKIDINTDYLDIFESIPHRIIQQSFDENKEYTRTLLNGIIIVLYFTKYIPNNLIKYYKKFELELLPDTATATATSHYPLII